MVHLSRLDFYKIEDGNEELKSKEDKSLNNNKTLNHNETFHDEDLSNDLELIDKNLDLSREIELIDEDYLFASAFFHARWFDGN